MSTLCGTLARWIGGRWVYFRHVDLIILTRVLTTETQPSEVGQSVENSNHHNETAKAQIVAW